MLSQVNREVTVEALPLEIPEHLDLDVSGMAIGDTVRLAELPVQEGIKFLDDPEETVLATVTMPTRFVEPEIEEVEGEEARAARGRGAGGRRGPRARRLPRPSAERRLRRARHRRGVACVCFVGANAPRRSTCWSRVSAIPGRSTSGRATTWAGSSSTSSRGGTAAPGARSSREAVGDASRRARLALLKPETYMNESGRSVGAAMRFFKVEPESCWSSTTTSIWRPAACRRGEAVVLPATTGSARSRSSSAHRTSCA